MDEGFRGARPTGGLFKEKEMGHERPVEPFSDLHVEDGRVRAVLLHDPTVEGLDMAIYMDASGSMQEEYEYKTRRLAASWSGSVGAPPEGSLPNQVEPQVQWMLEYLATKDRNGMLRVAYWACGSIGQGRRSRRRARGHGRRSSTSSRAPRSWAATRTWRPRSRTTSRTSRSRCRRARGAAAPSSSPTASCTTRTR